MLRSLLSLLAAFVLTTSAARADTASELAKCKASVTENRAVSVKITRHNFRCPGHLIVADENEIKSLPGFSNNHAYFKGVVLHGGDRVRYFVVVENWANPATCRVAPPLVRPGSGFPGIDQVPDGLDGQPQAHLNTLHNDMDRNWRLAALLLVKASARTWAESYEFARCKRSWPWQGKAQGGD